LDLQDHRLRWLSCFFYSEFLPSDCGIRNQSPTDLRRFLPGSGVIELAELFDHVVDDYFGPLHGRESAGVFGGEGFGAGVEERDKEVLSDQRPTFRISSGALVATG